jgi:hypothetical protein
VYPLQFSVSENIDVALTFSALEASNRLDLSLDFDSRSGLPVEPGSTLTITLTDGSDYAAISHSKKARTGIIYFTLFKSASGQPLNPEEKSLKAKLTTLEIKSLKVIADDKQRMIQIPDTKAAIIKTTIQCLLHSSTRK